MIQLPGLQTLSQRAKTLHGLSNPLGNLLRVLNAPGIKSGVVGGDGHDEFHTVEADQRHQRRLGGGIGRGIGAGRAFAFPGLVQRLRAFQQQTLVGIEDGAGAVRVSRKDFEVTRLPGKDLPESSFPFQCLRFRVNHIAVVEPDFAAQRPVRDFEDRGTPRQALDLDDVHQAFALHAAKPAVHLAAEQRLDAVEKKHDFLTGVRLLQKQVDPHGVGPGPKLRVHDRSHDGSAQLWEFAPHDRQDLQAVHFRHAQVGDKQREGLGIQQRNRPRAGSGGIDFRLARQPAQYFPVQLEQILIVINEEDFMLDGHMWRH